VVNGAAALDCVGDKLVFLVHKENAEMLFLLVRHGGVAIIHQARPVIEDGFAHDLLFDGAQRYGADGLYGDGCVLGYTVDLGKFVMRGRHELGQAAKTL